MVHLVVMAMVVPLKVAVEQVLAAQPLLEGTDSVLIQLHLTM